MPTPLSARSTATTSRARPTATPAGAAGEIVFRADSGFWSAAVLARLRAHDVRFSITVRQTKPVLRAIAAIGEGAWVDICYPDSGIAQVAETRLRGDRLIVRRVRHHTDQGQLPCSLPGTTTPSSPTGPAA